MVWAFLSMKLSFTQTLPCTFGKNHVEAVFVTKGEGEIEIVNGKGQEGQGKVYKLFPGVCYGLDAHEKHYLRGGNKGPMHVVCAFNPPCDGREEQNEDGMFPVIGEDGIPRY
ncbi:L-ectoine synthase [Balamuthia mandrillaris]